MGVDIIRVEYSIRTEPYGIIGGMYNILAYRRMIQQNNMIKTETSNHRPITAHSSVLRNIAKKEIVRPITTSGTERHTESWAAELSGAPSRLRVVGTKGPGCTYNLRSAANKTILETGTHKCSLSNKNCNTLSNETTNRQIKSEPSNNTRVNKTTLKQRK